MIRCLKTAVMVLAVMLSTAFPALADVTFTKAALVDMISKEIRKNSVKHSEIVRIVNAVFTEGVKRNIDPFLIVSLINTESKFVPSAKSVEGARGLMQVIPKWHQDKIKGRDINHIETNIEVGTKVLSDCLISREGNIKKALNCYSGGAQQYAAKLKTGYNQAKSADVIYRFKNDLPIVVVSKFETPNSFYISRTPISTLANVVKNDDNLVMLASFSP